jgi:hypothetical protein
MRNPVLSTSRWCIALAFGASLATLTAGPVVAAEAVPHTSAASDTLTLTPASNRGSTTDQNLFIVDNGGEVSWGAYAPCQLTGVSVTFSNGVTDAFPSTSSGTTAPGGVAVSRVVATGVNCTNTVGAIGITAMPDGGGYYVGYNTGDEDSYGDADLPSDAIGSSKTHIVAIAEATQDNGAEGYYEVSPTGVVTPVGATYYGSIAVALNAPIVGMAVTPDNGGYWLVASDGGVFAFGDAHYYGGMGGKHLNKPVVGMAADGATGGYWLVASDGGVFSFDAAFHGSTGNIVLNKPIVGMEAAPNGAGYRFVASDGGVFSFNLAFEGSLGSDPPPSPVVGMAPSGSIGYWVVEHDGDVQAFGSAPTVRQNPAPG